MSTELGLTAGLAEREDISVYMKRARAERAKAFAELFGFGFAAAKSVATGVSQATSQATAVRVTGRPA